MDILCPGSVHLSVGNILVKAITDSTVWDIFMKFYRSVIRLGRYMACKNVCYLYLSFQVMPL